MKNVLSIFCLLIVAVAASAQVVLLKGDYPDPSVLKDGDDYYMTHSPCRYKPGFLIWHSKDLLSWTPVCRACADWEGTAWAPDLQKVGDTYYIYFPANKTNWVITANDIRGPWSDPVDLKIGGIDPGLVVTPEGKRFLFTNAGRVTPLTDDGMARGGETVRVYDGWTYPSEWSTEGKNLESPKLMYRDGYYYMTSAEGGTAGPPTSHMAICARAKNLYGPWEESPYNPIVHTYSAAEKWWSKGHGTIVEGPDGQWWIVYHAYRSGSYSLGRFTLMEPIEWTQGGWYRPVKDMKLPSSKTELTLSDNFSSDNIGWQWVGWKENLEGVVSVKGKTLSLPGKGTSPQDGRFMMITSPESSYDVEVEVQVDEGVNGGLLLMYNEKAYAGLESDGKVFRIYRSATQSENFANPFGRCFRVRLENRDGMLSILVRGKKDEWKTVAKGIDIYDFHHNNYRSFLSLRPALYSSGCGEVQFRDFRYQPLIVPESLKVVSLGEELVRSSLR